MLSEITFYCLYILKRTAFIKTGIIVSLNTLSLYLNFTQFFPVWMRAGLENHSSTIENWLTALKPLNYYFILSNLQAALRKQWKGWGVGTDTGVQLFHSDRNVFKLHLLSQKNYQQSCFSSLAKCFCCEYSHISVKTTRRKVICPLLTGKSSWTCLFLKAFCCYLRGFSSWTSSYSARRLQYEVPHKCSLYSHLPFLNLKSSIFLAILNTFINTHAKKPYSTPSL